MPPGPTAPCSLAGLLAEFRPCFTAPTFHTFIGLVVGLIGQTRRRTVCGMLTGAGLEQVWHHSRAHRLFTYARWSSDALGLALADLIVTHLLPVAIPRKRGDLQLVDLVLGPFFVPGSGGGSGGAAR